MEEIWEFLNFPNFDKTLILRNLGKNMM